MLNSSPPPTKKVEYLVITCIGVEGSLPGREVQTESAWEGNNHLKKRILPMVQSSVSTRKWSDLNQT